MIEIVLVDPFFCVVFAKGCQVCFVGDHDHYWVVSGGVGGGDAFVPFFKVVVNGGAGNVVHKDKDMASHKVGAGQRHEAFLATGIPHGDLNLSQRQRDVIDGNG